MEDILTGILTGVVSNATYDSLKTLLHSQGIFLNKSIKPDDIPKLLKEIEQKCEENSAFRQEIQNIQNDDGYINNGTHFDNNTIHGDVTINNNK